MNAFCVTCFTRWYYTLEPQGRKIHALKYIFLTVLNLLPNYYLNRWTRIWRKCESDIIGCMTHNVEPYSKISRRPAWAAIDETGAINEPLVSEWDDDNDIDGQRTNERDSCDVVSLYRSSCLDCVTRLQSNSWQETDWPTGWTGNHDRYRHTIASSSSASLN